MRVCRYINIYRGAATSQDPVTAAHAGDLHMTAEAAQGCANDVEPDEVLAVAVPIVFDDGRPYEITVTLPIEPAWAERLQRLDATDLAAVHPDLLFSLRTRLRDAIVRADREPGGADHAPVGAS